MVAHSDKSLSTSSERSKKRSYDEISKGRFPPFRSDDSSKKDNEVDRQKRIEDFEKMLLLQTNNSSSDTLFWALMTQSKPNEKVLPTSLPPFPALPSL